MATDRHRARQIEALKALLADDDAATFRILHELPSEALVELGDAAEVLAKMARHARLAAIQTTMSALPDAKAFTQPLPDTPPDWPVGC